MHRTRRPRGEHGAAAVEFALVLLPLLYLVFGIIQYGFYFFAQQTGTSAANSAVRRLSVGDCQDNAELRAFIVDKLGAASPSTASSVEFLAPDGTTAATGPLYFTSADVAAAAPGAIGGRVTLTFQFEAFDMSFPFIPLPNDGDVVRRVSARVEDTVSTGGSCV